MITTTWPLHVSTINPILEPCSYDTSPTGPSNAGGPSPTTGQVHYDPANHYMYVFDGIQWNRICESIYTVGLDSYGISIMDWAEGQMAKEAKIKKLAENDITIKSLLDDYNNLKESLDIVLALKGEHK